MSRKQSKSKSVKARGVVDTSVLIAGIAGLKRSASAAAIPSATLLQRWLETHDFIWLISEDILDEYKAVLEICAVRAHVIGRVINLLRRRAELVRPGISLNLSPDPDDNHICDCAQYGGADFIVTLNARDFPQGRLSARVITPDRKVAGLKAPASHTRRKS